MKVCKLNVDGAPEVAPRLAVMTIPALRIFKEGKAIEKRVGAMSKEELEKFSQSYL